MGGLVKKLIASTSVVTTINNKLIASTSFCNSLRPLTSFLGIVYLLEKIYFSGITWHPAWRGESKSGENVRNGKARKE